MTILITGATGEFGRMLTDLLLESVAPEDLILITRNPAKLETMAAKGVTVRRGDFDDPDTLPEAFAGADRMLLISTARVAARVQQHANAIDAAVKAGVKHLVYTSTAGMHPNTPALVVPDHRRTEELAQDSGIPFTILRNSQYAEAVVGIAAPMAIKGGAWYSACGEGLIAPVSQADCVAAAAAVLTQPGHEGQIYTITGPELMSYRDIAALTEEYSGKSVPYKAVDDETRRKVFEAAGIPWEYTDDMNIEGVKWSAHDMLSYEQAIRGGYFVDLTDDVEKLTGRPPRPIREIFEEHRELLRAT